MHSTATPRVKICCNESVEEAWLAIKYGATAIGLVSDMPSGPGVISEDLIREIAAAVPPGIATFLLTCKQDAAAIINNSATVALTRFRCVTGWRREAMNSCERH